MVDNPHTPLLLGYDFLFQAKVLIDRYRQQLIFTKDGSHEGIVVDTHVAGLETPKPANMDGLISSGLRAHFVGYSKASDGKADVVMDTDLVLDPGEIMVAHMMLKKPEEGFGEYIVLETKPTGKHDILLWPYLICPDGTTTICIANRG